MGKPTKKISVTFPGRKFSSKDVSGIGTPMFPSKDVSALGTPVRSSKDDFGNFTRRTSFPDDSCPDTPKSAPMTRNSSMCGQNQMVLYAISKRHMERERESSRNKRVILALKNKGIDTKYMNLSSTTDSDVSSGSKINDSTEQVDILPSTYSTSSTRLENSRFEFDVHRGLRAFDLAVNPSVEDILETAKRSYRSDTTTRCDIESSYKRKKIRRNAVQNAISRSSGNSSNARSRSSSEYPTKPSSPSPSKSPMWLQSSTEALPKPESSPASRQKSETYVDSSHFAFHKAITKQGEFLKRNNCHHLPWLEERLEICSRSSCFTIPMDVFEFEKMTPLQYLIKYCRVDKGRERFYKNCLDKRLKKKSEVITCNILKLTLKDILFNLVDLEEITAFVKLIPNCSESPIELKTFVVVTALAERVLYAGYANLEQLNKYLDPRGFLERADFSGLSQKLEGVNFTSKKLRVLLRSLS